jgi:hypothetical protein
MAASLQQLVGKMLVRGDAVVKVQLAIAMAMPGLEAQRLPGVLGKRLIH